jgi:tRNA(fMet)-specific endonuclease VapC
LRFFLTLLLANTWQIFAFLKLLVSPINLSMYVLDTNICIAILTGDPKPIARLKACHPEQIVVPTIVQAELFYGARKSQKVQANLQRLKHFLHPLTTQTFDRKAAEHYGQIQAELEREGRPIGPMDTLIAAIARSRDLVVVTRNQNEFIRVAGLQTEVW